MGLIKAIGGALGGALADQWKEFFYCDSLDMDTLMVKGQKQITGRSSNTKGNDNVISNGSGIAVADGQCMIIVDQGKVVEVCAEPGEFTYDSSSEPSIFAGNLGTSILDTFKTIGKRFTYGGDTGRDQRVYYFNTKEIMNNKFGTPQPVPFRFVDRNIGLDIDISVRCNGLYSYKIVDPLLFYTNVCGNVADRFDRSEIDAQLKTEFIDKLPPALGVLAETGIRHTQLTTKTKEIKDAINTELRQQWRELRGIEVGTIALNPITISEEDENMIQELQKSAVMRDPTMGAATLVSAQADAMRKAAENEGGAMTGFLGMGMAMNNGGMNAQNLYQMGQQQQPVAAVDGWTCACGTKNSGKFCGQCGASKPEPKPAEGEWTCACGAKTVGKFCPECGAAKPAAAEGWTCACGAVNKGKFCPECGAKKPADAPLYQCDKCGWKPEDPKNPPKFCPECGDRFDENDQQ